MTKHVVGFSGGIDSQACAGVVIDAYGAENVILTNSDAGGNEHPLTTAFVEWYSANVFPVVMVTAEVRDLADVGSRSGETKARRNEFAETDRLTFDRLAYVKGIFPSRKRQFCTEYLKLRPQQRWVFENLRDKGIEYVRYAGVRADESEDRGKLPERQWDEFFDCDLVRPILRWSKAECFAFVKARGEAINPLYTMGFNRVGCAPCVNSSKGDVREWAARFPEVIDKLREWEKSVGKTFFAPCIPGKKINWIDEVVAWSKTTRGGKQLAMPMVESEAAAKTCVSKYGLCE